MHERDGKMKNALILYYSKNISVVNNILQEKGKKRKKKENLKFLMIFLVQGDGAEKMRLSTCRPLNLLIFFFSFFSKTKTALI
jgi:hypothetical protein